MPLSRNKDVARVRVVGVLAALAAVAAIAGGIANAMTPNAARDVRLLIPVGLYFLAASLGTILLHKAAALLLVVPLATAGLYIVIQVAIQGPVGAFVGNLILTVPLLCGPAFVVYRHRGGLR